MFDYVHKEVKRPYIIANAKYVKNSLQNVNSYF